MRRGVNDAEYFRSAAGIASSMAGIMEMSVTLGVFRAVRVKTSVGHGTFIKH